LADRKFGIGVVGVGMGAKMHALALDALRDSVEVRGVFRRDPVKRKAFAEQYRFPEAESLEALLDDRAVDALIVVTPPNAREAIVAAAARANKHVLMEKPVERTTAAAERIVAMCEVAGIRLGIVFQHRFRKASEALARRLASGELGPIAAVHLTVPWWRPQSYYDQPGRGTMAQDGGGVLITQAIHSLDLTLSLTGPVDTVAAIAGTTALHSMETEDFVGAGLKFRNGAIGALMATTANSPGAAEVLTLNCTKATAILTGGVLTLHWLDGRTETEGETSGASGGGADPMAFPFDWHQAQIVEFVDAVQAGRDPRSSGRTALEVHRLIDALMLSATEGRQIKVAR
jgi:UDP-N-acetyl-2-amino-2-deoxyglucuronate dehydrogenase